MNEFLSTWPRGTVWKNPARITKTFVTTAPSTIGQPEYYPKYCDKEIETFAREIFAHNTWLLESYETAERPVGANEKGERGVSVKRRKVTFPRNEGERDSDYLVRAVHRHMTEQARHRQRLFQSIDSIGPQLGATINSLSVNLGVLRPIRSF